MEKKSSLIIPFVLLFFICSQTVSVYFDVWWHYQGKFETFLSLPHALLYSAVFLGGMVVLCTVIVQMVKNRSWAPAKIPHVHALALVGMGSCIELLGGVVDGVYHTFYQPDITAWSAPHMLGLYGGLLHYLGVSELFYSVSKGKIGRGFSMFALGMSVACFQFGLTEFDVNNTWSYENRWTPYGAYHAILLVPVLAYAVVYGTRRFGKPLGTLFTTIAFLVKCIAFTVYEATGSDLYFPIVLMLGGVLYDLLYLAYRNKTTQAPMIGMFGLALGVVVMVTVQQPVEFHLGQTMFSLVGSIVTGMIGVWFANRIYEERTLQVPYLKQVAPVALVLALWLIPKLAFAHEGEYDNRLPAPDMHPSLVLLEYFIVLWLGYKWAGWLGRLGSKSQK